MNLPYQLVFGRICSRGLSQSVFFLFWKFWSGVCDWKDTINKFLITQWPMKPCIAIDHLHNYCLGWRRGIRWRLVSHLHMISVFPTSRKLFFSSPFRTVLCTIHVQVTDRPSPDAPSLTQAIIVQMVYCVAILIDYISYILIWRNHGHEKCMSIAQLFRDPEVSKCNQSRAPLPSNCTGFHGHHVMEKLAATFRVWISAGSTADCTRARMNNSELICGATPTDEDCFELSHARFMLKPFSSRKWKRERG